MATTISVDKQNVQDLLKTGRTKPFVIPEYQRPYAWTDEQIETMFEDIWEFATTIGDLKKNGSYFLGSIVSFENEDGEQEIIDGQQRITSLFLLLRAIYTKLIQGDDANTEAAQNFIKQIEPAIWRTDNLTGWQSSFFPDIEDSVVNENIEHRDEVISDEITHLLSDWNEQYTNYTSPSASEPPIPTPEDLEMIKKLKEKGLI